MDFLTSRRSVTTYGRPAKRVLVHDIFESRVDTGGPSTTATPKLSVLPARSVTSKANETRSTHDVAREQDHSKAYPSITVSTSRGRDVSPVSGKDADLFEMRSSEDEEQGSTSNISARKRQKIARPPQKVQVGSTKQATILAQKFENAPVRDTKAESKVRQPHVLQKQTKSSKEDLPVRNLSNKNEAPQPIKTSTKSSVKSKPPPVPRVRSPIRISPDLILEEEMHIDDYASTDTSAQVTDASTRSIGSSKITPRRKRILSRNTNENDSSPSQLGITSLRLTPDKVTVSDRLTSPGVTSDDSETPRRVRPRLIDRLDGPIATEAPDVNSPKADRRSLEKKGSPNTQRRARGRAKLQQQTDATQPASKPSLERSQSSQNRTTYATKARTTYAKERSHLSDMVNSLDSLLAPSSQHSSQGFPLQASTSNLASSFDLEDDESDSQSGTKVLKSIHELRQAGVTSRFDRETQVLLEDIETSDRANKSLRLRALSKLSKRLSDEAFLRYFVSSDRISRLSACSALCTDLTSKMLFTTAMYILSKNDSSLESLACMFNSATNMAHSLLQAHRTISDLAQDPAEKLSKSDIKEFMALEEYLVGTRMFPMSTTSEIYSDHLILTFLDEVLRGLMRHGDHGAEISATSYTAILRLLERHAQQVAARHMATDDLHVVEKALSLLEMCSIAFDNVESSVRASQYQVLGNSLATIMRSTTNSEDDLEQSILKVVVSLSNNKPTMCHLLGKSSITDAVFLTVDNNFVTVANRAEQEQTLDQKKLDSVILALGCLLNFAECDSDTRKKIARSTLEGQTYLQRLVGIFNSQVDKVQEVTTSEQSQVLVAFGYLCMLLCTMSLDAAIRKQITELLKNKSFEELCAAAETFFSHLRTLENISEEDASMGVFTARFSAILAMIRSSTGSEG